MIRSVLFLLFISFFSSLYSQSKEIDEVLSYLHINKEAKILIKQSEIKDINLLANTIGLDYPKGEYWLGYVNEKEYTEFLKLKIYHKLYVEKTPKVLNMAYTISQISSWDKYPTYLVYDSLMRKFATDYPNLCSLDTIGYSINDKLLLCLRISTNPNMDLDKPKFFYSSTIHGDEITGAVLLLRLADWLLSNYNTDQRANDIINNTQVFINPIANPDGMYRPNDISVSGATRYNANYIDLNRNFPGIKNNPHPDNNSYQRETLAFIDYATRNNFSVSANLHGGAEVLNYPWDSYKSSTKTHVDNNWFIDECKRFIDSFPIIRPYSFFKDVSYSGYTNGGDWYVIDGGRQDYHNYFKGVRELTMEVSSEKSLSSNSLNDYWNYLNNSLIGYIETCQKGIEGYVYDSTTNSPIQAIIKIENHDDNTSVVVSKTNGYYYRPIKSGNYKITYSSQGYASKSFDISIAQDSMISHNVFLTFTGVGLEIAKQNPPFKIYPNPVRDNLIIESDIDSKYIIYSISGSIMKKGKINRGENNILISEFSKGVYIIETSNYREKIIKN